jgi:putative FmdB family regulatory protein
MPIFEYRCTGCAAEFEKLVRGSETPACPSCHSQALEKKLSVFATAATSSPQPLPASCQGCGQAGGPACSLNS